MHRGLEPTPPESALAAEIFQKFCDADTMNHILSLHGQICEILNLKPSKISDFYSKLKVKLANSWKAQALFKKLDLRAANKVYSKGNACANTKVLIIGAGPCGLRAAIECQFLGAKVVICEKRDRFSRNNVLHLWPFTINDLRALGAKKFYGKFCAGSIDHISIQRLQCILLKVALILGVEFHGNISFEKVLEPTVSANNEKLGWRALVSPADHPVGLYEFDVIMGANGNKQTILPGFKHKVMRGRLAIAITANFINHNTEAEAAVQEISGITFIYNQTFFLNLLRQTGIDLENLVYYKDDTHYFVMTAKKNSLLEKGVLLEDYPETSRLLSSENINHDALQEYAREAAFFSTLSKMPEMEFALNHYGEPDVAIFDFTSTCASENASAILESNGQKLLMCLIGDGLLEPFWPTGSGCARGFLSAMDACWAVRSLSAGHHPLAVIAERESIYRLLAQTTPENLHRDISRYTLEPSSRYPNLNRGVVSPHQVTSHYHTDDMNAKSAQAIASISSIVSTSQASTKKRKRDSGLSEETVLQWVRRTLSHIEGAPPLTDVRSALSGSAICGLLQIYRPDLLASKPTDEMTPAEHAQWAYNVLHKDLLIQPLVTGVEITAGEPVDGKKMMQYLNSVYHTFKGEIPHVKHPDYEPSEAESTKLKPVTKAICLSPQQDENYEPEVVLRKKNIPLKDSSGFVGSKNGTTRKSETCHCTTIPCSCGTKKHERSGSSVSPAQDGARKNRKRRSATNSVTTAERVRRIEELAETKSHHSDRHTRRQVSRLQLYKSQRMLLENSRPEFEPLEEYCLQLYRQSAPCFKDRVNQLEQKLLYPDRAGTTTRESILPGAVSIPAVGKQPSQIPILKKKPQDLLRAVGKLSQSDWQIQFLEGSLHHSRFDKQPGREREKVPKWTRAQFMAVQNKITSRIADQPVVDPKFSKIDETIKKVEKQMKDGSNLEVGIRGSNKVSDLAKQFKGQTSEESKSGQSTEKINKPDTNIGLHETDIIGEDSRTHRPHVSVKTGKDRVVKLNNTSIVKQSTEKINKPDTNIAFNESYITDEDSRTHRPQLSMKTSKDRVVKLNNIYISKDLEDEKDLSTVLEEAKPCDEQDKPGQVEMDEEELNEHNFPATRSTIYLSCDEPEESSSSSNRDPDSTSGDEYFSDKLDDAVDTSDSSSIEDSEALRIRHREIPRPLPPCVQSTTTTASETETDTEVESDWESSSDDARSGTEVSTDSEFAHDDPTLSPPPYAPPRITINDEHEADLHNYPEPAALFGMVKVCITGNDHNARRHDRRDKEEIMSPQIILKEPIKRPTEFSLSRTRSTSGIAAKRALELKKKYLLGDQSGLSIQKSDSASQLDSKFKSFQSNISEFQKLLNPGSDISPCMQAFLANSSKRNFPTSPSTSMFIPDPFKPEKEVEEVKLESNIITEPMPDIIQNLYIRKNNIDDNKEENHESKNLVDLLSKHNLDVDMNADSVDLSDKTVASDEKNSVLEQQLVVPEIDRDTRPFDESHSAMESDIESDSLLDSDNTEEQEVLNESSPFVPRVEVHDETGALMQPDSLMMVENESVLAESPDEKVENVCESTNKPAEEAQPSSYQESDESANDVTALALSETELSDWAIDGAALEDYEDEDLKICSSHKNLNRLKKTKGVHKTKNVVEAKDMETPHVCGKDSGPKSMFAKAEEEFDFMDMGSQDSLIEAATSTTNVALLKNRGFLEFVDVKPEKSLYPKTYNDLFNSEKVPSPLRTPSPVNDRSMDFIEQPVCTIEDDGLPTPTSNQPNGSNDSPTSTSADDSPVKELQDTTESSSSNNNELSKAQDSVIESTTDIPLPVVEFEKKFRIDPVTHPRTCQNISDLLSSSSDMHYYSNPADIVKNVNKDVKTENDIETNLDKVKNVTKSPQTARRVEEIMKEKVKQKDLVREMVMDRLLANRLERRSCKRNRQSPDVADAKALKLVSKDNNVDSMMENKETRLPEVSHIPGKSENVSFADSQVSGESIMPKSRTLISKVNDVNGTPSSSAIPQLSRSRTDSDVRLNLRSVARSKPYTYETDESQVSSIKSLKHASGSKTGSPPSYADSASLSVTSKPNSMSDPNIPDSVRMDAKKSGKERRRSIIRTVSEFFNKRLSPKTKEVSKLISTPQKCQSVGDMQYIYGYSRRPERPQSPGKLPSGADEQALLHPSPPSQRGSEVPPLPNTVADLENLVSSLEKSLKMATLEESEQETFAAWFAARAKLASLRQADQAAAAALADTVLASRHSGLVGELRRSHRSPEEEGKLVGEILAVAAQRDSLAALYEKHPSRSINKKGSRGEK